MLCTFVSLFRLPVNRSTAAFRCSLAVRRRQKQMLGQQRSCEEYGRVCFCSARAQSRRDPYLQTGYSLCFVLAPKYIVLSDRNPPTFRFFRHPRPPLSEEATTKA